MRRLLLILFLLTSGLALQAQGLSNSDEQAIRDILERQRQCWNEGDIECFMIGYWESDELRFMGKKGVTKGFKATKERYYKSYPDKAAMGQLTFTILSVEKLSRKKALVIGKWELARTEDDLEGHFSLIWEKQKGEWVVILDHSS